MEPPGWMTAMTPALAASSIPSAKGKKASEASMLPWALSPARLAACTTESTRLGWPVPMPTVDVPCTSTIALDLTCFDASHANARPASISGVGCFLDTTFHWLLTSVPARVVSCGEPCVATHHVVQGVPLSSGVWTRRPPKTLRTTRLPSWVARCLRMTSFLAMSTRQFFFLLASHSRASGV
jgi:hypothetical protein